MVKPSLSVVQGRVLFVSKPVAAPFHDGSQVLVREVANHLRRLRPTVMGTNDRQGFAPHVDVSAVYPQRGGFAPGLVQNLRPLGHLLTRFDADIWHFVFAPNRRSCRVIRALRHLRHVPTLQTIASPPRQFDGIDELLFGDVIVVQSHWTARHIRRHSHKSPRIEVVRPPIGPVADPTPVEFDDVRRRLRLQPHHEVIVYPGDLEFSDGARCVAAMVGPLIRERPSALVVFACRRKTQRAVEAERRLAASLNPESVRFAGELPNLKALLALAKLVVFPVEDLYAKVDIPIALLEAMKLGVPVLVPTQGPAAELTAAVRVDVQQTSEWVASASGLLASATERASAISRQREQIASEFDAQIVAAHYEELYEGMLEG